MGNRKSVDGIRSKSIPKKINKGIVEGIHTQPHLKKLMGKKEKSRTETKIKIKPKQVSKDISSKPSTEEIDIFKNSSEQISESTKAVFEPANRTSTGKKISPFQKRVVKILVFCIFIFVLFSFLDKTTIHVRPEFVTESIQKKVSATLYPKYGELGFDIISITESDELLIIPQTEIGVEERATGTIRIFNNYSSEPQRLVEETRFEAVGGKIFKLGKGDPVIVPGKLNGNPGSVDVVVYAESPGPKYNIDLTDFSVPGFQEAGLDEKYAGIYALSVEKMSGGFVGTKKVLSSEQELSAVQDLQFTLQMKLEQRMNAEKTNQFFLAKNSSNIVFEDVEKTPEGDNIRLTQKARGSSLIISKENLEDFVLNNFFSEDLQDKVKIDSYTNTSIENMSSIDFDNLDMIDVQISLDITYKYILDSKNIINTFLHQPRENLLPLIDTDSMSHFDIRIFPFWRKTTSESVDKFRVNILQ